MYVIFRGVFEIGTTKNNVHKKHQFKYELSCMKVICMGMMPQNRNIN